MFVYVDSVDYIKKEASVHFSILIYTSTNASQIGVNFESDANGYIMCERGSTDQSFFGESKIDNWPLRGSGEAYPFDSYRVNIAISRQFYIVQNGTLSVFYPEATLRNVFNRDAQIETPESPFWNAEFSISVGRNSSIIPIELMIPVLVSFFIVGFSVLLGDKINERLSVYVGLLFFSPIFLFAIQNYLPSRSTLSIPEIFIICLIVASALLCISVMVQSRFKSSKSRSLNGRYFYKYPYSDLHPCALPAT